MCTPEMLVMGALSGGSMLANNSAQNAAARQSQKIADEQTKLSKEQFDTRQTVIRDSDARIRELERQGYDRSDAARVAYQERVGDILEQQSTIMARRGDVLEAEGARTGQMRADQEALIGTAIDASDFDTFSGNTGRFAAALDGMIAGEPSGTPDMAGMSPETQRELQRREAEMTAEVMGREAKANKMIATNFALDEMGQALEELRLGSGVTSARFDAGSTLPGDLRAVDLDLGMLSGDLRRAGAEAGSIAPELRYIDQMTGIKSDRTQGTVGASQQFEGTMADLAQRRAAAIQPNTLLGDLLAAGSSAAGAYAMSGGKFGDFFGAKPAPVKPPIQLRAPRVAPAPVPYGSPSPIGWVY